MNNKRRNTWFKKKQEAQILPIQELINVSSGSGKWAGSCYCPDNNSIYFNCWNLNSIGKFNLGTQSISYIPLAVGGTLKYASFIYAFGKIYGLPFQASQCFVLDPIDDSILFFGTSFGTTIRKWYGGALSDNGFIYGSPWDDTNFLKVDPIGLTATRVGATMAGINSNKHSGMALIAENKLAVAPRAATKIKIFDAAIDDWNEVGTAYTGTNKWLTAQKNPNGKVYFSRMSTNKFLEFDPTSESTTLLGSNNGSSNRAYGFGLAPNGLFFTTPGNYSYQENFNISTNQVEIMTENFYSGSEKWIGSPVLAPDNCLYFTPFNSSSILKVSNIGTAPSDAFIFPSSMTDFHLTNWNLYQNLF